MDASQDPVTQEAAGLVASRSLESGDDAGPSPRGPAREKPAPSPGTRAPSAVAEPLTNTGHDREADRHDEEMLERDRAALKFYPITRFLGFIKDAVTRGEATEIRHERLPPVRIYPRQRLYKTPSNSLLDAEV